MVNCVSWPSVSNTVKQQNPNFVLSIAFPSYCFFIPRRNLWRKTDLILLVRNSYMFLIFSVARIQKCFRSEKNAFNQKRFLLIVKESWFKIDNKKEVLHYREAGYHMVLNCNIGEQLQRRIHRLVKHLRWIVLRK